MAVVKRWALEENFWKVNPDLKWHSPFKEFRANDKTYEHNTSSKEMWFIALCYDYESPKKNYPIEDRITLGEVDYLKHSRGWFDKNKDRFKDVIEGYNKEQQNSPYRNLARHHANLDRLNDKIQTIIETGSAAQMTDAIKLLKEFPKLYQENERLQEKLRKDLESKNSYNQDRGEAEASMLEEELEEEQGL